MLVITLHGFGQTGDGDELSQDIIALANKNNDVGLAPTYPTNNPHLAHIRLCDYVETKIQDYNSDVIFVGHSLGGFWARHLAKTFGASRLILINPTQSPWQSLQPYVGMNRNSCNGEQFELAINDANAFYIYRGDDSKAAMQRVKTCLIATESSNQDIIDKFSDKRNVEINIVGGYDDILPAIQEYLYPEKDEDDSVE